MYFMHKLCMSKLHTTAFLCNKKNVRKKFIQLRSQYIQPITLNRTWLTLRPIPLHSQQIMVFFNADLSFPCFLYQRFMMIVHNYSDHNSCVYCWCKIVVAHWLSIYQCSVIQIFMCLWYALGDNHVVQFATFRLTK